MRRLSVRSAHIHLATFGTILILSLIFLAQSAFAETVTLIVHDYPTGDGPSNLASNGIPFDRGILSDEADLRLMDGATEVPVGVRVLARWHGDNSVRVVLLQFAANFASGSKTYSLQVGTPRSLPDISVTEVAWDFPKKIITLPASYLCDSRVVWEQAPLGSTNFLEWEQKQVNNGHRIDFDGASLSDFANDDQYYNSIHTSYELYVRSGDIDYLINGRKWALHHARDQIYLSGPNIGYSKCPQISKTRYTYVQGLVDDYFFWGHNETRDVAGIVVDNFYMTHPDKFYYVAPGQRNGLWTEREPGFALIGLVAYYEATNDPTYLTRATERVDKLHEMQMDNGGTAWIHSLYDHDPSECGDVTNFGVSPWMTGLLLEGIIKYHKLTGYGKARESVLWALDYLMNGCVATGAYAGKSFPYMCGCTETIYVDGVPDVSNLMSHAFAYGYVLTTENPYRALALDLIDTAVQFGYTGSAKHFNQQFRSSGHAIAYLEQTGDTVPSLLASFEARYGESGVEITWDLAVLGAGMQFFVLKSVAPGNQFIEISQPNITSSGLAYRFADENVADGLSYRYQIDVSDDGGRRLLFQTSPITIPGVELSLSLDTIYPNPFNPDATITFTIPQAASVVIRVYDARGRLVRELFNDSQTSGTHSLTWNGLDDSGYTASSGVYYVRLESLGLIKTRKVVLLR